jgi:hypothetical protein
MTTIGIQVLSFKNVTSTYCGKTGCACGCGGTYARPSHVDAPTYATVSDRTVKIRLNKILKALKNEPEAVHVEPFGDTDIWEYEYGNENEYGDRRVIRIYATRD